MAKGMRCPQSDCRKVMYADKEEYLDKGMYVTYVCFSCGFKVRRYEDY